MASCENMVSAKGLRPGDILTAASGKTVEVNNTDAEGRLTLADAMWFAQEKAGVEVGGGQVVWVGGGWGCVSMVFVLQWAERPRPATAAADAGRCHVVRPGEGRRRGGGRWGVSGG